MEVSTTKQRHTSSDVGTLWTVQRLGYRGYRARCALVARPEGWEIRVLVDGTPLITERSERAADAFALADSLMQRMLRDGWQQVIPRRTLRRAS